MDLKAFTLTSDSRLTFEEGRGLDHDFLRVWNKVRGEYLGEIAATRCGKFLQWAFSPANDTYFTRPCMGEIEFVLGSMKMRYGVVRKKFLDDRSD